MSAVRRPRLGLSVLAALVGTALPAVATAADDPPTTVDAPATTSARGAPPAVPFILEGDGSSVIVDDSARTSVPFTGAELLGRAGMVSEANREALEAPGCRTSSAPGSVRSRIW